jgi:hypothetical protein
MEHNVGSALVELLPLIIGAAVVPIPVIIVLLLLSNTGGLLKGAAFVGGAITVRLAQGFIFSRIFSGDPAATSETGSNLIASTLLTVLGVLMLIAAYKKWAKEDDPDAPPPKWMAALGGLSAPKAFGMGAVLVMLAAKQWVFTLSAIAVIGQAQLAPPASTGLFVVYVLAAQALGLIALIAYAVAPRSAGGALAKVNVWLERNNRPIMIGISLIFGLFFLFKGVTGLIG